MEKQDLVRSACQHEFRMDILYYKSPQFCNCLLMMTSSNVNIKTPRCWSFVRGIHRSPVNSPQKKASEAELWFFYLRLNKRLSKRWWGSWFQTPSRPLWRRSNVTRHANQHMYYMGLIITSLLRQTDVETLASVHKKVDFELRQLSASTTNFNMGKLLDLWCKTVEHVDEIHRVKFIVSMKAFQNENILTRPELHAYESTCINSNTCWTRIHFGWSAAGSDSFCCQGKLLDGCSGGAFQKHLWALKSKSS